MQIFLDKVFDHRVGRGRAAGAEVAAGAAADEQLRRGRHHAALPLRPHLHQRPLLLRPIQS